MFIDRVIFQVSYLVVICPQGVVLKLFFDCHRFVGEYQVFAKVKEFSKQSWRIKY